MLTLVPTPIGNLEDISKRSLKALFGASTILCEDTRITGKLLALFSEKYSLDKHQAKLTSLHSHNEKNFIENLEKSFFDDAIVYVSDAGMPGISDPGQLLVDYCLTHDIPFEILPGASASILAFVASGFVHTRFLFGGFLPHKGKSRSEELNRLAFSGYTTIVYEAPHRLYKLLEELSTLIPDRRIFLAKELSKKFETKIRGTAKELYAGMDKASIKGEWIVVIEAGEKENLISFTEDEILELNLPIKDKSKLLARFGDKSAKAWYEILNNLT